MKIKFTASIITAALIVLWATSSFADMTSIRIRNLTEQAIWVGTGGMGRQIPRPRDGIVKVYSICANTRASQKWIKVTASLEGSNKVAEKNYRKGSGKIVNFFLSDFREPEKK